MVTVMTCHPSRHDRPIHILIDMSLSPLEHHHSGKQLAHGCRMIRLQDTL